MSWFPNHQARGRDVSECLVTGCEREGMVEVALRLPPVLHDGSMLAEDARTQTVRICDGHPDLLEPATALHRLGLAAARRNVVEPTSPRVSGGGGTTVNAREQLPHKIHAAYCDCGGYGVRDESVAAFVCEHPDDLIALLVESGALRTTMYDQDGVILSGYYRPALREDTDQ